VPRGKEVAGGEDAWADTDANEWTGMMLLHAIHWKGFYLI